MFSFQGASESQRNSMKHLVQDTSVNFLKKKWWAKMDSNHRPHDYQSCALASWAIGPYRLPCVVESTGIEPVTSCLQGRRSPSWANPPFQGLTFKGTFKFQKRNSLKPQLLPKFQSISFKWWRVPGSNRWPPACKAGALPAELTPHF